MVAGRSSARPFGGTVWTFPIIGNKIMQIRKGEKEMKSKIKGKFLLTLAAVITILFVSPAISQEKPADNMQIVREKVRADKKLFVAANMELTESESKGFWPLYERYQKDLEKLGERTLDLIKNYAMNFENMSDEAAKKMLDEWLALEMERQKMREAYLPKFREVLPERKVARYYQLENKILAVVNYELAAQIPLVQ